MADELGPMPPVPGKKRGRPPNKPGHPPEGATAAVHPDAPAKIPRPRINVLERSVQHPFGIPSSPVDLKEPGLVCRWVNTDLKGGAQFQYALSHGWLQVKPDYVKDLKQIQHTISPDGFVTRGERHKELLMYTTIEHFNDRRLAKNRENERMMNPAVVKRDITEAAAQKFGSEAADYLNEHVGPVGDVRTQYERIQKTDDPV